VAVTEAVVRSAAEGNVETVAVLKLWRTTVALANGVSRPID
jgi:hypothetical protein